MRKERATLKTAALLPNTGQLDWLPKNPRQWTKEDVARTVVSIEEDTDFLEDRPLLVVPHGKRWVVFAGNLRHTAASEMGLETVPCVVYFPETEDDQLTIKRRAMKDNGSFGSWDYDELANAWDDLPLAEWGVPAWDNTEFDVKDLEIDTVPKYGESESGLAGITFVFKKEDAQVVTAWIKENGKETMTEKIIEICQAAEAK